MSKSSKEWTEVDYIDVNEHAKHSDVGKGLKLTFGLSPMDVPVAWRNYVDDDQGEVVIEFMYLSSSEPMNEKVVGQTEFKLGKNSKRIYKISSCGHRRHSENSWQPYDFADEAKIATVRLDDSGMVKPSNAKAIISMLDPSDAVHHPS